MANVKISQLPSYTGNISGSWLVMNNSGETTTYKVQRENVISGLATTSSLTALSSSIAVTDLSQNNRLTSIESVTSSFAPSGNYATTGSNVFNGDQTITGSVSMSGSLNVVNSFPGVSVRPNRITANGAGGFNIIEAIGAQSFNVMQSTGSASYNIIAARGDNFTQNQIIAATNFISSSVKTRMVGNIELTGSIVMTGGTQTIQGAVNNVVLSSAAVTVQNNTNTEIGSLSRNVIYLEKTTGSLNSAILNFTSLQFNDDNGTTDIRKQSGSFLGMSNSLNITGSLIVSSSAGTTSISGNSINTNDGSVNGNSFYSNSQLNFFAGGTNNDVQILAAGTGSILLQNRTGINGNTSITGSLITSGSVTLSNSSNTNIYFNSGSNIGAFISYNHIVNGAGGTLSVNTNSSRGTVNVGASGVSGSLLTLNKNTGQATLFGSSSLSLQGNNINVTGSVNVTGSAIITGVSNYLIGTGSVGNSNNLTVYNGNNTITSVNGGFVTLNAFDGNGGVRINAYNSPSGIIMSGSVNIKNVMTLEKQNPLPTGTTGSLAVSGSGLYFHNGTSWNLIS